jgi:cell shape-determining protein MreC
MTDVALYLSIFGTLLTGFVSFFLGTLKIKSKREQFYENKISELLRLQALEIKNLKSEVEKLVKENQYLRKELEKGYSRNERFVEEVIH